MIPADSNAEALTITELALIPIRSAMTDKSIVLHFPSNSARYAETAREVLNRKGVDCHGYNGTTANIFSSSSRWKFKSWIPTTINAISRQGSNLHLQTSYHCAKWSANLGESLIHESERWSSTHLKVHLALHENSQIMFNLGDLLPCHKSMFALIFIDVREGFGLENCSALRSVIGLITHKVTKWLQPGVAINNIS